MAEPRVSPVITAGSPVPVDASCRRCKREGVFHVVQPLAPRSATDAGEFVTATGSTDDSRHWLNSWKMIFLGLLLGLPGAYFTYLGVDTARIELRKRRGVVRPKR